ncbi:MAG: hypothetical protein QG599_916 [Pseudomonadota bacterium]|nr:hypothetical protein [Pseudomonadota bacterium]
MSTLWPPLTVLENELFTPSDALMARWQRGDELPADLKRALETDPEAHARRVALDAATVDAADQMVTDDAPMAPMPPDLRALIRRRVAARQASFSPVPTPGQIVRIDEVRGPHGLLNWDLSRPLAVLLNEPTETPNVWYGWLATAETDYASDGDLLLGAEDEPCDPLARMIQLWNPVHVYLPSVSRVLAELRPERLAAVRALAVECLTAPASAGAQAQLGVIVRRVAGTHPVRTGTPLGSATDPRHRYQQLYHAYAEAVREPARQAVAQEQPASLLDRLRTALFEAIGDLLQSYQLIAQPMGEADAPDIEHYQIPHRLRLTLTETADGQARLRVENLHPTPLQILLLDNEEIVEAASLEASQPVIELMLDPAQPRVLIIGDEDQPERYRIPIFAKVA